MKKAIILYREDMDLENVIDFVQKKVKIVLILPNSSTWAKLLAWDQIIKTECTV